ncbi:MAG: hypothetical protein Ct9H300mP28_33120 [Pseudomonadota bacterium]|nr:MAG: hypothetical protein Ct9H300mP28_33120 [Pseudomonadota bacterium]
MVSEKRELLPTYRSWKTILAVMLIARIGRPTLIQCLQLT